MVLTIPITPSWGTLQSITTQPWACTTPKVCLMFLLYVYNLWKVGLELFFQWIYFACLFHFKMCGCISDPTLLWLPSETINHTAIISHKGHPLGSSYSTLMHRGNSVHDLLNQYKKITCGSIVCNWPFYILLVAEMLFYKLLGGHEIFILFFFFIVCVLF